MHDDTVKANNHLPFNPSTGIRPASLGLGWLIDNHENRVRGDDLYVHIHGELRHYHLTKQEHHQFWDEKIARELSVGDIRLGDIIPLAKGVHHSPLETYGLDLEAHKVPFAVVNENDHNLYGPAKKGSAKGK